MESYLLQKISHINTETKLDEFWSRSQNSLCLNQHRHAWFNDLFRAKEYTPRIKTRVLGAVESRRRELSAGGSRAPVLLS